MVPLPVRGMVRVEPLLMMVRVPDESPATVGEKLRVSCWDCFAARVNGVVVLLSA